MYTHHTVGRIAIQCTDSTSARPSHIRQNCYQVYRQYISTLITPWAELLPSVQTVHQYTHHTVGRIPCPDTHIILKPPFAGGFGPPYTHNLWCANFQGWTQYLLIVYACFYASYFSPLNMVSHLKVKNILNFVNNSANQLKSNRIIWPYEQYN